MRRQLRLTLAQRQHAGIVPRCDTRLQLQPLQRTSLRTSGIRLKKRGARNSRPQHVALADCPDRKPSFSYVRQECPWMALRRQPLAFPFWASWLLCCFSSDLWPCGPPCTTGLKSASSSRASHSLARLRHRFLVVVRRRSQQNYMRSRGKDWFQRRSARGRPFSSTDSSPVR